MAKKYYYAVRAGLTPGVYNTWDDCQKQTKGFSGAIYKKFETKEEAEKFVTVAENVEVTNKTKDVINTNENGLIAYVDGSYNEKTTDYSYGMVILVDGKELKFAEKFTNSELASMRNVAGEIKGAESAMKYAVDNGYAEISIYYDYEGISRWCTGEWKATKEGTKKYKEYYDSIKELVKVNFVKVKGHSNDKYNDMADELAKSVIFSNINGDNTINNLDSINKAEAKNVYINRDLNVLKQMLVDECKSIWDDCFCSDIVEVGIQYRFEFKVQENKSTLDIYQKDDGTTTFRPTGQNISNAKLLKEAIERKGLRNTKENKTHTFILDQEWTSLTLEYLKDLEGVECVETEDINYTLFKFKSYIGDKLTIKVFKNSKVTVQGKPLYLYNEFLSIVSHSPKVTLEDVVNLANQFNDTVGETEDIRGDIAKLMPNAYNDNKLDEIIWKLLSPSAVIIKDNQQFEDYSVCVFPVLRALEAYIKFLLKNKGIVEYKNFGSIFSPQNENKIIDDIANQIGSSTYESALVEIYKYFKSNRHVLFHVDNMLIDTKLTENKQDAIDIYNEVTKLIEDTYNKVKSQI